MLTRCGVGGCHGWGGSSNGVGRKGREKWSPKGRAPPPEISRFFSLSRHSFHSFLPLLLLLSWNFGGVRSAGALKCARMEFSGCRVKPRRPQSRRGFTPQPESPNVHIYLRVPSFNNTTKIPREDPQRGKKRTNFAAGEGKNRATFWAVQGRAVPGRAVPGRAVLGREGHRT